MRYQLLATALAAQLTLSAAMPSPDQTVYETEVDTITSCAPEVTNCPARSHPATAAPSQPAQATTEPSAPAVASSVKPSSPASTAPASGTGTCEEQENMCRTKPGANMAQCSADRAACDGYIPGQSSGTASGPAPSGTAPASGTGTCKEQENMCRTKPGANMAQCSADRAACDGYIPGQPAASSGVEGATSGKPSAPATTAPPAGGDKTVYTTNVQTITSCGPEVTNCPARSTGTATGPAPSGTSTATCEQQENMCRTQPGANMAQCSAERAACDGYIPGQASGTGSGPASPSGTAPASGTSKTCEEQENMCRTQPGANMAQCSAERASCDGYVPGQGSVSGNTPGNATASLSTPTPASPTPAQWTGAASASFVSFGLMGLGAAAAAFVM